MAPIEVVKTPTGWEHDELPLIGVFRFFLDRVFHFFGHELLAPDRDSGVHFREREFAADDQAKVAEILFSKEIGRDG